MYSFSQKAPSVLMGHEENMKKCDIRYFEIEGSSTNADLNAIRNEMGAPRVGTPSYWVVDLDHVTSTEAGFIDQLRMMVIATRKNALILKFVVDYGSELSQQIENSGIEGRGVDVYDGIAEAIEAIRENVEA